MPSRVSPNPVRLGEMGSKYLCVVKIVFQRNTCNLKLLVGGILQQYRPLARGSLKRGNPAMRDEHTLMRTVKKSHNFKLGEKVRRSEMGSKVCLCSKNLFSEKYVQF